jgi:hypothetical protein
MLPSQYLAHKYKIEEFMAEVQQQTKILEELKTKNFISQTNVQLIKAHFFENPSQMTLWAINYNNLSFLYKVFYGFMVTLAGACLGSFFNLTLAAACFSLGIFIFLKNLLCEHYENTNNKIEQMCQDIHQAEKSLQEASARMNLLTQDTCTILERVCHQNIQSTSLLKTFQEYQASLVDGIQKVEALASQLENDLKMVVSENIPEKLKVLQNFNTQLFKALEKIDFIFSDEKARYASEKTQELCEKTSACFERHQILLQNIRARK